MGQARSKKSRGQGIPVGSGPRGSNDKRVVHEGGPLADYVFDMTTPPISSSDLLFVSAGPGGFSTVDAICGIARSNKAHIVFVTAQPEFVSAQKYADLAYDEEDDGTLSGRELLPMVENIYNNYTI